MAIDENLLRELEQTVDGAMAHRFLNLAALYKSAACHHSKTGDESFAEMAREFEVDLRIMLAELRQQRALLLEPFCSNDDF